MRIPTLFYEHSLWNNGFFHVCGLDEVGRGAWAGPLIAAAVVFPAHSRLPSGIRDSKLLSPRKRQEAAERIKKAAIDYAYGEVSQALIDKVGVGRANMYAMRRAIAHLKIQPHFFLIDYFSLPFMSSKKQQGICHGDGICYSIAAASIIAKVYRDELMAEMDSLYGEYHFAQHKGYGTKGHQEAIEKFGLTNIHRRSFIPERLLSKVT